MSTREEAQRIEQSNDIAYKVIEVAQNKAPSEFVTLDFRYGIADALWDAGYRKVEQADRDKDQGTAANCHLCVGAGGYEDYDGEWRECSCQRADRGPSEPVHVQIAARKGGKSSTLADMIVERANARGIRVEFVTPDRKTLQIARQEDDR